MCTLPSIFGLLVLNLQLLFHFFSRLINQIYIVKVAILHKIGLKVLSQSWYNQGLTDLEQFYKV